MYLIIQISSGHLKKALTNPQEKRMDHDFHFKWFSSFFILHCSQEKEENLVQRVSKDPTGQLEHQGSQDTQDPWGTRGRGVSLASQENLDPL